MMLDNTSFAFSCLKTNNSWSGINHSPLLLLAQFVNLDFSSTSPYTDLSAKLQFLVMPFPACARQLLITRMPSLYTYASFEQNFSAQHFQHAITLAIITYENLTALKIHNAHICSNIYFNKCNIFAIIKWAK